ncbi:unnamed protein product, partial [Penicillium nalgiovense]
EAISPFTMILVTWCLLLQAVAFSPTYAHLRMTSPEPYGSSRKTLDNSPLAADGSDFPCKISPGDFIVPTEEATYRTGSNNSIKLLGSATHGGGSCQVSLTSDREPTKNSEWKVIKSYEGGCPAKGPGNLDGRQREWLHYQRKCRHSLPITDTADTGEANSTTENANSMPCSCGCQGS